jgi:serine/threonine-protein kinase PpkA
VVSNVVAPRPVVLFIDDDESMRDYAQMLLEDEAVSLIFARDGVEGISLAHQRMPELILCDLMMPGMDGFEVLSALRADARFENTRFVMVTAREDRLTFRKAMNLGVDDFITKPFRRDELVQLVHSQITRRLQGAAEATDRTAEAPTLAETGVMAALTCHATVLFSDVRDFTAFGEALSAADVAKLLRNWFRLACVPLAAQGVRTTKFIGDGLMALFEEIPGREPHAKRASAAAMALQDAAAQIRGWAQEQFTGVPLPAFRVGVGLHTGEVAISVIGTGASAEVSTLGDTVNLAARIEETTKSLGCSVLASIDTLRAAGDGVRYGALHSVTVKGRAAPIEVAEILAVADANAGERAQV